MSEPGCYRCALPGGRGVVVREIENMDAVAPGARRRGAGPGCRLLMIATQTHGFRTLAARLRDAAARRADIAATVVLLRRTRLVELVGKSIPGMARTDRRIDRNRFIWRRVIRGWLKRELPLHGFDAVHGVTQHYALGVLDAMAGLDVSLSVSLDATGAGNARLMGSRYRPDAHEARVLRACDVVACMSGWAAGSVEMDYGAAEERVMVTPPSVSMDVPTADLASRRHGKPRIVMVGKPWHRKGGDRLVRAFRERLAGRAELVIVCADAPAGTAGEGVTVHASMPRERIIGELLPSADVFALPTRLDQSPWVLAEAAAAGLPVVSFAMAGLGELVVDGETGVLAPRDDEAAFGAALERLVMDPELRIEMGRRARAHAVARLNEATTYDALMDAIVAAARRPEVVVRPGIAAGDLRVGRRGLVDARDRDMATGDVGKGGLTRASGRG